MRRERKRGGEAPRWPGRLRAWSPRWLRAPRWPGTLRWRGTLRRLRALPLVVWVPIALAAACGLGVAWQVARKPTELLGLVAPSSAKTPASTWETYGPLFEAHATEVVTPELLAALAQVESAGDPLARTYWRFRWGWNPLELYAPASSAVGLLQITDGTYAEARRLCIHDHAVARTGPWYDPSACWLNALYFRTVPGHAIEMTSALLDAAVADVLAGRLVFHATLDQQRRLAAVIHLCGRERGAAFAARGFRARRGERCGDHDLARYVGRVEALRGLFERMGEGRSDPSPGSEPPPRGRPSPGPPISARKARP